MSYRILKGPGTSDYIVDEQANRVIAIVVQSEGCKPLVELANRAATDAVEKAKKRTEAVGSGSFFPSRETLAKAAERSAELARLADTAFITECEWITWATNTLQQLIVVNAIPSDMRAHVDALIRKAPETKS